MYPSLRFWVKGHVISLCICICAVLLLVPKASALELSETEMNEVNKSSTIGGIFKSVLNVIINKGFEQTRKKAEEGDVKAQYSLAQAYLRGLGVPRSNKKAAKWFRLAADQGDAESQFQLSLMYQSGIGIQHDSIQALQWLRKAAEHNNAKAQYQLAKYFESGKEKSVTKSLKWMRKSANNGLPLALNALGEMYFMGDHVSKDYSMAFSLFQKAAQAGFPTAMENLSRCYEKGLGVDVDVKQADLWLTKAAKKGSPSAQLKLGIQQGNNISWITKSAETGFPAAQYRLGIMYISGDGAEEHASKGFYWLVRAQGSGSAQAEKRLNEAAHWMQGQLRNSNEEQSK